MTKVKCEGLCLRDVSRRVPRRKYKRHTKGTYVKLLVYIIQGSPNKMLTFRQIMDKLGEFVSGHRRGLENNIRVCLSSNKCFVKEPIDPNFPHAKRNFWKVDVNRITPKMMQRHFGHKTTELSVINPQRQGKCETVLDSAVPASSSKNNNPPTKFSSSFSIESLLKEDHSTQQQIPCVQDRGVLCDFRLTSAPTFSSIVCLDSPLNSFTHHNSEFSMISAERNYLSHAHYHYHYHYHYYALFSSSLI